MKNFKTIFNFEFKQLFKKKSIMITTLIYMIIAFGITFIPSIINGNSVLKDVFSSEDNSNFQKNGYVIKDVNVDKSLLKEAKSYDDKESLIKDIQDGKIETGMILTKDSYEHVAKASLNPSSEFTEAFDEVVKKYIYTASGVDYNKVKTLNASIPNPTFISVNGGDAAVTFVNSGIVYVWSFIIYITVLMFGTTVAINVIKEKSNRAMELLLVAVKPRTLILGKVFALSLGALLQMSLLIGSLILGIKINLDKYSDYFKFIVNNIDLKLAVLGLVFTMTGFFMLMFLYSSAASLVSSLEEVNSASTIATMLLMAGFFGNLYVLGQSGAGKVSEILSYIPFTSYFVMFTRYAVTDVPFTQIAISYSILLATTIIIMFMSIKIYRNATLRYGKKLSFFKMLREK